jgi:hypothetical protein
MSSRIKPMTGDKMEVGLIEVIAVGNTISDGHFP